MARCIERSAGEGSRRCYDVREGIALPRDKPHGLRSPAFHESPMIARRKSSAFHLVLRPRFVPTWILGSEAEDDVGCEDVALPGTRRSRRAIACPPQRVGDLERLGAIVLGCGFPHMDKMPVRGVWVANPRAGDDPSLPLSHLPWAAVYADMDPRLGGRGWRHR